MDGHLTLSQVTIVQQQQHVRTGPTSGPALQNILRAQGDNRSYIQYSRHRCYFDYIRGLINRCLIYSVSILHMMGEARHEKTPPGVLARPQMRPRSGQQAARDGTSVQRGKEDETACTD